MLVCWLIDYGAHSGLWSMRDSNYLKLKFEVQLLLRPVSVDFQRVTRCQVFVDIRHRVSFGLLRWLHMRWALVADQDIWMQKGEKFALALNSSLNPDGTPLEPAYNAVSLHPHRSSFFFINQLKSSLTLKERFNLQSYEHLGSAWKSSKMSTIAPVQILQNGANLRVLNVQLQLDRLCPMSYIANTTL